MFDKIFKKPDSEPGSLETYVKLLQCLVDLLKYAEQRFDYMLEKKSLAPGHAYLSDLVLSILMILLGGNSEVIQKYTQIIDTAFLVFLQLISTSSSSDLSEKFKDILKDSDGSPDIDKKKSHTSNTEDQSSSSTVPISDYWDQIIDKYLEKKKKLENEEEKSKKKNKGDSNDSKKEEDSSGN